MSSIQFRQKGATAGQFLYLLFLLCVTPPLLMLIRHGEKRDRETQAAVPVLFTLVAENTPAARQKLDRDLREPLGSIGNYSSEGQDSVPAKPLMVRMGNLDTGVGCQIFVSFLRKNPDAIEKTDVSFNGTPLKQKSQIEDLSCGGEMSYSTLRVAAKDSPPKALP
jgi:hypothetical protein